jgi:hypothetical protein
MHIKSRQNMVAVNEIKNWFSTKNCLWCNVCYFRIKLSVSINLEIKIAMEAFRIMERIKTHQFGKLHLSFFPSEINWMTLESEENSTILQDGKLNYLCISYRGFRYYVFHITVLVIQILWKSLMQKCMEN